MINSIRSVRRAKGLTLEDVAVRCVPPTTAQTIGRIETGTRTASLGWLNRIAAALDVDAAELVRLPQEAHHAITALIGPDGAQAPSRTEDARTVRMADDMLILRVSGSVGDYRAGDDIWCRPLSDDGWAAALNRDVLIPRPAGRYLFGRLLNVDGDRLHLLPLTAGARQQVVAAPSWVAVAARLVREL